MIDGTIDLATIERNAYQQGDMEKATLAALALDAQGQKQELDDLRGVIYGIEERITEANWRTGKKAELRELIEAILGELAEAPK